MKNKVNMYKYESMYARRGYKHIVGIDEVGRGAWAGPIVVAGVILPNGYRNDKINDSKKLSPTVREKLFKIIVEDAVDYVIKYISPVEVDKLNPKVASVLGMKQVIQDLEVKPDIALIDAEKVETKMDTKSMIKGDEKSISIAAASIVAKVSRDQYMSQQDKIHPQFYFSKHKGYGTAAHLKALKKYGPIKEFHRVSYKPIQKVIETLNKK